MTGYSPPADPVIEAYKRHVDVSLLHENLRKTPDDRMRAMISMMELVEELRRAVVSVAVPAQDPLLR
jgi:hypothetical protein